MSEQQIQRRLASGVWIRLDNGVYAMPGAPATWDRQLRAAYLSRPEVRVAGRSAALLNEFPGVSRSKPEILVPFTGNARSPLARVIRSRHYELISHRTLRGMEVTTPAETILALSYTNPPASIERWVDGLMAASRLEASEFDPIFARLGNAPLRGLKALRRIVMHRDHDAYQPPTTELERMLYRLLDRDDLPDYERQLPFDFERAKATVDAYMPEWRIIVESDGRRWHTRVSDFEKDRERDNAAAAEGYQVIRFTFRMLKSDPDSCAKTLINAGRWR